MYNTIAELLNKAEEQKKPLWVPILENEMELSECTENGVFQGLKERYQVMEQSSKKALNHPLKTVGGLIEGIASTHYQYTASSKTITGPFLNTLMARALSCSEVNASMGKICAAPTAGACGILPSVLISMGEKYKSKEHEILEAMLTASGIGAIIMQNATVAGAEGGCQAECGVAAAMASAAAVQLAGGSNEMSVHAVSLSLMNVMGLICDPIAGLVQVPCAQRNASQAVNAVISADLALAGMPSLIPADQVISAMYKVGKMLPIQLKETSQGGIAAEPAGKEIYKHIFHEGKENENV